MSLILLGILNSQVSGAAAGAYDLLESTVLTSSASSVTFSSLGTYAADYKHLQIRYVAKDADNASGSGYALVRMNGDTNASSYIMHALQTESAFLQSLSQSGYFGIRISNITRGDNSGNIYSSGVLDFLDAFSSSKNTTVRMTYAANDSSFLLGFGSGLWNSTAALSSINISQNNTSSSAFRAGSRFSLYGVK